MSNQTDINFNLLGTNPYGIVGINSTSTPVLMDLDGDGGLDIMTGAYFGELVYYRNVGTATAPSFTKVGDSPFGLGSVSNYSNPAFADLDGDGDLDALIGVGNGGLVYYRNVGTSVAPASRWEAPVPSASTMAATTLRRPSRTSTATAISTF
ncbi:FG-GAP-like repeat-containing protein [Azospirillum aestuarii]|uniref:FG-GAP-like repeat-containing protein n=1 Tax=Azospirillum aestuarii TaxID=2802052 RepID=UPI0040550954